MTDKDVYEPTQEELNNFFWTVALSYQTLYPVLQATKRIAIENEETTEGIDKIIREHLSNRKVLLWLEKRCCKNNLINNSIRQIYKNDGLNYNEFEDIND